MVISEEIKFPRPIRIDPYRSQKKVAPIDGLAPVARIGAFRREWHRDKKERRQQAQAFLSPGEETAVRSLVEKVNNHLENQKIIGDVVIDLNDLPVLLKNLQQEAGILLDTIS